MARSPDKERNLRNRKGPYHAGLMWRDVNKAPSFPQGSGMGKNKTYNSGYSPVVTHLSTNPPVRCLNRAERTGSLVFNVLWSYVRET